MHALKSLLAEDVEILKNEFLMQDFSSLSRVQALHCFFVLGAAVWSS